MTPRTEKEVVARGPQRICEVCRGALMAQRLARGCLLHSCPQCEHVVRDLHLCPAGAREEIFGGSEKFDRFRLFFTRRKLLKLIPQLSRDQQLDVLEVGFGDGELLSYFQERGHRVYGVEAGRRDSPRLDRLRDLGGRLHFQGLGEADLPPETMDLIYMIHVAEHLPEPLVSFGKLAGVAKKGALLYLVTPNGHSTGLRIFRDRWWHLEDPTHSRFFTPRSMETCLRKVGFAPIRMEAPLLDSLTLEINSLMRLFYRRGAVMDHALVKALDILLLPFVLPVRFLWRGIRPSLEVLARKG
jgi:SAM-dependent methyltransferase